MKSYLLLPALLVHHLCNGAEDGASTSTEIGGGIPLPRARFTPWALMRAASKTAAKTLQYTKNSWDAPDVTKGLSDEGKHWNNLEDNEKDAAGLLGFSKNSWDCYEQHYYSFPWSGLVNRDLAKHYATLGWTEEMWTAADEDKSVSYPEVHDKKWNELTTDEQNAAMNLCFFKEIWNKQDMSKWNCFWNHGDLEWSVLHDGTKSQYEILGWTEDKWDNNDHFSENMSWGELSVEEKNAAEKLCYYRDTWNSHVYEEAPKVEKPKDLDEYPNEEEEDAVKEVSSPSDNDGLTGGAKFGIFLAVVVGVGAIVGAVVFERRRRPRIIETTKSVETAEEDIDQPNMSPNKDAGVANMDDDAENVEVI